MSGWKATESRSFAPAAFRMARLLARLVFTSVAPGVGGAQLTYVRKISGSHAFSKANEAAI